MKDYREYFTQEELEYARTRCKFKTLPNPEDEEKVMKLLMHLPANKEIDYKYQEYMSEKD